MINPLPIKIKFKDMDLFKDIPNITYDENADIEIVADGTGDWSVSIKGKLLEYWTTLKGVPSPRIIYLTDNKELLPYCMKDRLASIQDRLNKNLINV